MRVSIDGLAVGKIDDGQQADDGHADGHNVGDPHKAQGNQQRQGSFRAVGSRTERIQPEHRNAGDGANLFCAFF
jgi:hypothetical protein